MDKVDKIPSFRYIYVLFPVEKQEVSKNEGPEASNFLGVRLILSKIMLQCLCLSGRKFNL